MTTDKANRDQLIHEEESMSSITATEQLIQCLTLTYSIVQRKGFYFEEGSVCIVLEYMDSGSLDHVGFK